MVIDSINSFLYIGTSGSPGMIVKVALGSGDNPPQRVGVTILPVNEQNLSAAVIDTQNGYAYFGGFFGTVTKVSLGSGNNPPVRIGGITLNAGEINLKSAAIDINNGYAYFGTVTSPGIVIKVALGANGSSPARIGAVTLNTGENSLSSGVIDSTAGYGYFAAATSPGRIVKVRLGQGNIAPTRLGTLILNSGENQPTCSGIDPVAGYAYIGTYGNLGQIVKVSLGSGANLPSRVGTLFSPNGINFSSNMMDVNRGFAYFSSSYSNFMIKTTLGNGASIPQYLGRLDLNGLSSGNRSVIDTTNGYAYLDKGQKIALSAKNLISASKMVLPENSQVNDVRFYSHTASGTIRLGIYDNSSPRNLLWQSAVVPNTAAGALLTVPITSGSPNQLALSSGTYWLAWQTDSTATVGSYIAGVMGDGFTTASTFGNYPATLSSVQTTATADTWTEYITYQIPTTITAMTPAPNSILTSAVSSILLTLSDAVNASTVTAKSVVLKSSGLDGILDTADDVTITPTAITVVNSNQIKIDFPTLTTTTEQYRVTLLSSAMAPPPVSTYAAGRNPVDFAIADMDNDGKIDLVIADNWGTPNPTIILGDGTGKFGTTISINNWNAANFCIAVADFNLDGKIDIVQGGSYFNSNCPIIVNTTTQSGTVTFAPYVNFPMGSNDNCVRVADFNGDGKPDLVSCNQSDDTVGVRLNTTPAGSNTLSFSAYTAFTSGNTCRFVAVGDINGDGKPDIVSCNFGTNTVSVLVNTTPANGTIPTFASAVNFTTDTQPCSVELADINGDGKMDIIVPCSNANVVNVFINSTTTGSTMASFQAKASFADTLNPTYVSVEDIDGDGKPDIACANETSNDIGLLINTTPSGSSTPTFAPVVKYAVGSRPVAVKIADLNGAGNKAIVSANYNSNTVSVIYPYLNSIQNTIGSNLDGEFSGAFPSGNGLQGGNFTATFAVNRPPPTIPTTLSVTTPTPIAYGSNVSLSATVSSSQSVDVGTITFQLMNGNTNVGSPVTSGIVSQGVAGVSYIIPTGTPIGTYTISAIYNWDGGFIGSTDNSKQLAINAASLSVTAANTSRVYAAGNPTLVGTVVGVQNGEIITATYATSATLASSLGGYDIVPTLVDPGGKLGNYSATLNNGTLTVTAAPLFVSVANFSRSYGAANPMFTGSLTGVLNNDGITATFVTSAVATSTVGSYTIVPAFVDPNGKLSNYAVSSNNGTLTVTPIALTAGAFNATRTYGAANPVFSGLFFGVVNGDNILALYNTVATPTSPVGNYAIVPELADPDGKAVNYTVALSNGTLTISQATPTITWATPARIFAGMPLDATQLNATASDPITRAPLGGTFEYEPVAGTVLASGLGQSLHVVFTPNDAVNYNVTSATTTIDVETVVPVTITSPKNASATKGDSFSYTITATGSVPMTFAADGMPAGLTLTGAVISGIPTVTGVFNVTLTVSNYAGSATQMLKIVVVQANGANHVPAFTSPPISSANPAAINVAISLTISATDVDGDALEYAWDFGDGTTGGGASVSKTFTAAGTYVVNVVVSDGQASDAQSIVIVVDDQPPVGAFIVTKVIIGFNFIKNDSDSLALSGVIPLPAAFKPMGKTVRVLIGDLDTTYVLDSKGVSADKAFALKGKQKGASIAFTYTLKKRALFASLENLGFSKTASHPSLIFPVVVVLDGESYLNQPVLIYTVKGNTKGPVSGHGKK